MCCLFFREAKLAEFEIGNTIVHKPRLGRPLTLNCVPPTSFPKADVDWVLRDRLGRIRPINYDARITMDLEGKYLLDIILSYF